MNCSLSSQPWLAALASGDVLVTVAMGKAVALMAPAVKKPLGQLALQQALVQIAQEGLARENARSTLLMPRFQRTACSCAQRANQTGVLTQSAQAK